jgi:hypothetical protein
MVVGGDVFVGFDRLVRPHFTRYPGHLISITHLFSFGYAPMGMERSTERSESESDRAMRFVRHRTRRWMSVS